MGSVLRLRKLASDYDPTDRVAAMNHLLSHQAKGENPDTGLIFVDPDAEEMHDYLGTVSTPLNQLQGEARLPVQSRRVGGPQRLVTLAAAIS